jgi:hypothetical protein
MANYVYTPQNDQDSGQGWPNQEIVPQPEPPHVIESASATTGDTSSNNAAYIVAALVCVLIAWLMATGITSFVNSPEYEEAIQEAWDESMGTQGSGSGSYEFDELSTSIPS